MQLWKAIAQIMIHNANYGKSEFELWRRQVHWTAKIAE